MPAAAPRRSSLPARIALWRRRVVVGSLGLFAAAWIAVASLGRQATSSAVTSSGSSAQSSSAYDPGTSQSDAYGTDGYGSASTDAGSGSSSSTQSAQQSDLSAPSTRQS